MCSHGDDGAVRDDGGLRGGGKLLKVVCLFSPNFPFIGNDVQLVSIVLACCHESMITRSLVKSGTSGFLVNARMWSWINRILYKSVPWRTRAQNIGVPLCIIYTCMATVRLTYLFIFYHNIVSLICPVYFTQIVRP